ncbi:MAG: hypothetical protein M3463_09530 [Verrucomicrobiota bacterium]|nr:hypothetical protein [Verrucomicrobiota bacterium]
MRFIHSADWQFGTSSGFLRARAGDAGAARLRTLRRALALASERAAQAFIIGSD